MFNGPNHRTNIRTSWRSLLSNDSAMLHVAEDACAEYKSYGTVVVRRPMLPFNYMISRGTSRLDEPLNSDGYNNSIGAERRRLNEVLHDDLVREAIYIASPNLSKRLVDIDTLSIRPKDAKTTRALFNYVLRMSTRPTPFGLFAVVGSVSIGDKNVFSPLSDRFRRQSRIDLGLLVDLSRYLTQDRELMLKCSLYTNSSTYRVGVSWRYLERFGKSGLRLASVQGSDLIDHCLASCRNGVGFEQLFEKITHANITLDKEDFREFVVELVKDQLLIPHIFSPIASRQPVRHFVRRVRCLRNERATRWADAVSKAQDILDGLRTVSSESALVRYRAISQVLDIIPVQASHGVPYQIDAQSTETEIHISEELCSTIGKSIAPLLRFASPAPYPELVRFVDRFVEQFGDAEVPLTQALDADFGVELHRASAPAGELLKGLPFSTSSDQAGARIDTRSLLLLRKLSELQMRGYSELAIDDSDLAYLRPPTYQNGGKRCSVVFELAGIQHPRTAGETLDVYVKTILSPVGDQFFGRFRAGDVMLDRLVGTMSRAEESDEPDKIFADVVYAPSGRLANVTSKPPLRKYEIPYLAVSTVDRNCQIVVEDLLVSVRAGRVRLRWTKNGAEVIPRLGNAHNIRLHGSPPIYQFLVMIGWQQGGASFSFRWPLIFDSFEYLPRVRLLGNVVSLARWRLHKAEMDQIKGRKRRSDYAEYSRLTDICCARGIPRFVWSKSRKGSVFVDLKSPMSVLALLSSLRSEGTVTLVEAFQRPDNIVCRNARGSYATEFIVPLQRKSWRVSGAAKQQSKGGRTIRERLVVHAPLIQTRRRWPGGHWACFTIYGSTGGIDEFVRRLLPRALNDVFGLDLPEFFFVRYGDPEWHLRLRIKSLKCDLWTAAVPRLLNVLREPEARSLIKDLKIDSYLPEVERYGGIDLLRCCESIFCADSTAAIAALQLIERSADVERWEYALASSYAFARDFFPNRSNTLELFDFSLCESMARFERSAALKECLARKYRVVRRKVERIMCEEAIARSEIADITRIIEHRSEAIRTSRDAIYAMNCKVRMDVVSSLIHMSMNRIFASNANGFETVVYYLCVRALESMEAREAARLNCHRG